MACAEPPPAHPGFPRRQLCALVGGSLLWAGLLCGPVLAETYKWVDDQGRIQYTDRLPPEAARRGSVELSKQGVQRKVVAGQPTQQQIDALESRKEQDLQAQRAAVIKRNQENALLSSYTNEGDIDLAKRRNLALVGAAIISAEARIKALQRRQAVLEKEKLFFVDKPLPDRVRQELAMILADIPRQQALIGEKNIEALAVIERYEQQKIRFRELRARAEREGPAVPVRRPTPIGG